MMRSSGLTKLWSLLCPWRESGLKGPNSPLIVLRAEGSRICVPMPTIGQREKARAKWPSSPKVGTRREKKGKEPGAGK